MFEILNLVGALTLCAAALPLSAASTQVAVPPGPVLELRQYKIARDRRDEFVAYFEQHFVETQDRVGMPLLGQFRDTEDPDRFTWIRSFSGMEARKQALSDFYLGPVWQAHRDTANPMLIDNDNVLLLRPARATSGFAAPPPRPDDRSPGAGGVIVVNIHYLWKEPDEGFTDFFLDRMAPALRAAGLPVLGAYVTEKAENTFPRLPVRQGEKVFVWFTRAADAGAYRQAMLTLANGPGQRDLASALSDFEERAAQVLVLAPTPRSALR
jgi:hypothetical protein